jgi:Pathogenicity locus
MLETLPNIGKAIAIDLRAIGIETSEQLSKQAPLTVYCSLAEQMGHRHDPCVLYTLLSVKHYLDFGEKLPWWNFTEQGKQLLKT